MSTHCGRHWLLLALLALLAQQWFSVPSAMELGMQLQTGIEMTADMHEMHKQHTSSMQDKMPCCDQPSDCHCNPGSCLLHPALVVSNVLTVSLLPHVSQWAPLPVHVPQPKNRLYRPPIA